MITSNQTPILKPVASPPCWPVDRMQVYGIYSTSQTRKLCPYFIQYITTSRHELRFREAAQSHTEENLEAIYSPSGERETNELNLKKWPLVAILKYLNVSYVTTWYLSLRRLAVHFPFLSIKSPRYFSKLECIYSY